MAVTEPVPPDLGARARLEAAFAREERRGLMQAAAARSAAVAAIIVWLAMANPDTGLAYAWNIGTACFFLLTGLTQFWLYRRPVVPTVVPYAFMLVDSLALAGAILLPNPLDTMNLPPALPLRYASFMYFFILLMQAAFSFRPRLLLWTGLSGVVAWTLGFLWIATRPESILLPGSGRAAQFPAATRRSSCVWCEAKIRPPGERVASRPRHTECTNATKPKAKGADMSTAEDQVRRVLADLAEAIRDKDAAAVIALLADDEVTFDLAPPLRMEPDRTHDPAVLEEWFATWQGPFISEPHDLEEVACGEDIAYAFGLRHMAGTKENGEEVDLWFRAMHNSVPFAMDGRDAALLDLKP